MGLSDFSAWEDFSAGHGAKDDRQSKTVALAGNPNVGKSTVFNALTGLRQHTGNWCGKTVSCESGVYKTKAGTYRLVDIPGTYSLLSHSAEEEAARDYICFGGSDACIVVCDASALERNLNLALQIAEIHRNTVLCLNLLDEAEHKGIGVDTARLSSFLGIPVIGVCARKKKTLSAIGEALDWCFDKSHGKSSDYYTVRYPEPIEEAADALLPVCKTVCGEKMNPRYLALRLIENDEKMLVGIDRYLGGALSASDSAEKEAAEARKALSQHYPDEGCLKDEIVSSLIRTAEEAAKNCVTHKKDREYRIDRCIDAVLTGRYFAFPVMLLLLAAVFWLTVVGANIPSEWLGRLFARVGIFLREALSYTKLPVFVQSALTDGVYNVLSRVISVMLPPMLIFFPLFTLLEDAGVLPRIAYDLDLPFKKCHACGKQGLCMCMSFGCNAVGVEGCRIIDSERERLLAILTNNFLPCNGRFPTLIALTTLFFAGTGSGASIRSALFLTLLVAFCVFVTFGVTKLLSMTLLRGSPSSFVLEMPPYRMPQVGKVLLRSVLDRTLFVLGRAAAVAAPAGLVIYLLSSVTVSGVSLLSHLSAFLDPVGHTMGMDGVILCAFILGFPANEIVLPIAVMAYMSGSSVNDLSSLSQLRDIFLSNGWTWTTALSVILFSVMHFPCSTTLLTIAKETRSVKLTLLSALIPTLCGFVLCTLLHGIFLLFGIA